MSFSKLIPLVDVSPYVSETSGTEALRQKTMKEVHHALQTTGFMYLKNHGISQELVEDVHFFAEQFFQLPYDVKMKHIKTPTKIQGYEPLEYQRLNAARPPDLKEGYRFLHLAADKECDWPDEVPDFKPTVQKFQEECRYLSLKVLEAIADCLKLEDPHFFEESHHIGDSKISNVTGLRVLKYPPVTDIKPDQIRCGEHTDWGSITLLFQDSVGGLEVQSVQGEWLPVTPIPNTVLVNIGDLMQRWTADKLMATKHRVIIPEEGEKLKQSRRSLVYFVVPDDPYMVRCLDGSNKYDPISYSTYMKERATATYY